MPEGDTVHKIAAYLKPLLEGEIVRSLRVRPGVRSCAGEVAEKLQGLSVKGVEACGKHLFITFEGGWTVRSHLGLHGSWHRYAPGEPWRKNGIRGSLVLETEKDVLVCFNAREVEIVREEGWRRADLGQALGPDLLGADPDLEEVLRRARLLPPATILTDVLLDQRVAGGIGNVYQSEVLFLGGRDPRTPLADIPDDALRDLFALGRDLLRRNLGGGPRRTRFEDDGRGRLWVYGRAGRPCLRCGATVRFAPLGRNLRTTFWCPRCQR